MSFSISLKNRLALTYTLFIGLALAVLAVVIYFFTGVFFTALVKDNIAEKSREIISAIESQYNPFTRSFDTPAVEAMGMYFVHEGYIVSVEDAAQNPVWNARSCDMRQCMDVINSISARMEKGFGVQGVMQTQDFPLNFAGQNAGSVSIETYGPYFYSETEMRFINSINRLLLISGLVLVLLSAGISSVLSRAIVRPVLKAGEAARLMAKNYSGGFGPQSGLGLQSGPVRINDQYKTKELAELSRSINTLAEELEEAQRRQKRLTADIAHELRTPLTCLQGNIEAMLDGVFSPGKERLKSCHEEIVRLAGLVQDLNTLTSLEWDAISLNKTQFDIAELLRITAGQFSNATREKGIALRLHLAETPVNADWDRLKQVFINLLSNAVQYTGRGSITITIEKTAPVCVCLSDTGTGIAPEDLPHIFERLYRGDKSRSRGTGGAGIGLAIAAAIIRAHNGAITAESSAAGSVFRVWL
jgi:signal transduction histidine kinase